MRLGLLVSRIFAALNMAASDKFSFQRNCLAFSTGKREPFIRANEKVPKREMFYLCHGNWTLINLLDIKFSCLNVECGPQQTLPPLL